jgi:hypothetical protein
LPLLPFWLLKIRRQQAEIEQYRKYIAAQGWTAEWIAAKTGYSVEQVREDIGERAT